MIKLYGVPMSRASRSLWMLEELGVPYENVPTHFATGDTRKPEYLALNPNGHIPTLQDGDLVLWESMAINLYLARRYDKGLWPKSVADEGRTYQWSLWAMTELEGPLLAYLMHTVLLPKEQRDPAKASEALAQLAKPLGVLEGALTKRSALVGEAFGAADLNVASVLSLARLVRLDLSKWPQVDAWLGRCLERPASKRAREKR
ncbi:MAG TPA: glutathione S-transferase family protein [Deltaproteobacteria bacterium]|nr:glutathione S-transferase family protein [Deltaproteobacteria bacterium]